MESYCRCSEELEGAHLLECLLGGALRRIDENLFIFALCSAAQALNTQTPSAAEVNQHNG